MRTLHLIIYMLLACFVFSSCETKEKKKIVFDNNIDDVELDSTDMSGSLASSDYNQTSSNVVSIPYTEQGGVKLLDVSINGVGLKMIFDTGCSGALISVAEARYLYEKGTLTEDDFIGVTKSQIADGSIVENMVVNLKEVVIGNQVICPNVQATVSPNNNAPLLLGGEIINRFAAYSVDNENKVINFKVK